MIAEYKGLHCAWQKIFRQLFIRIRSLLFPITVKSQFIRLITEVDRLIGPIYGSLTQLASANACKNKADKKQRKKKQA